MHSDKEIRQWAVDQGITFVIPDGYPEAFLGVQEPEEDEAPHIAIYSRDKVIEVLQSRDGMSEEEASEFFDFNIAGAYIQGGPIFIRTP